VPEAVPVRERVLSPPMFVRGSWLEVAEAVALEERKLLCPGCTDVVNVANVDAWKFEGTVGIGTFSPPLGLRVLLIVRMDRGAELLDCAAPRSASQSKESVFAFMLIVSILNEGDPCDEESSDIWYGR